ncbi:Beta-amylase [Melia azedarach]|uniref:Beta-amylase n=1 Tax=Melia azedarach TaxID=155640 RepID=A0ACC1WUV2_MELAZ|nr:Beta-amylase [Melia azedarach]
MKATAAAASGGSSGGGVGGVRSESEKEKTKLRERQRRAITTKIFHGLRKWGGYHLSPRSDINEVLRELAKEAGWIVEPDGTTYRARVPLNHCPACGGATSTTSSGIAAGGGDSSTTESPRHVSLGVETMMINNITAGTGGSSTSPYFSTDRGGITEIPLALYIYGAGVPRGPHSSTSAATTTASTAMCGGGAAAAVTLAMQQQQQQQAQYYYNLQEVRASNQNTPVSSPLRRPT